MGEQKIDRTESPCTSLRPHRSAKDCRVRRKCTRRNLRDLRAVGASATSSTQPMQIMQGEDEHMQDDYQRVSNYTVGSSREPSASFPSICAETFLGSVYGRKAVRPAKHVTSDLLRSSIHKTFIKFDQQLRDERVLYQPVPGGDVTTSGSGPLQYSETTATTLFISDEDIIFANLGDSRTILCRNNKLHFETKDHSPAVEDEAKRVKAAGGRVHTNPNKHTVIMDPDVNGKYDLSLSRAFADFAFKVPTDRPPDEYIRYPLFLTSM